MKVTLAVVPLAPSVLAVVAVAAPTVSVAIGDVVVAILGSPPAAVRLAVAPVVVVVVVVVVVEADVVIFILYVLAKIVRDGAVVR